MCSILVVIGICVAIFGQYGAAAVDDNERRSSRNVSIIITPFLLYLDSLQPLIISGVVLKLLES